MKNTDFKKIEKKWQKKWEEKKIFKVKKNSKKKKFYCLDMFPYPSGEGLHMGHAFVYTLGDIFARFKRLQGFNVLYPIGYDSLGLPAENAAIKIGMHPLKYTQKSIDNFMKQQKAMGWSYDWSRLIKTSDPSYYKWDQWIFLKMLEKGLAYRKKSAVNYCKKCDTVLANEQVVNGKCWRHEDTNVEIKHLEQWFFKVTDYADELLEKLEKLDWPDRAKKMQRNWIGRSEGTEIDFEIETPRNKISNVIIVHGSNQKEREKLKGGSPPQNERNWLPWIKKELEKKGIKCEIPLMPESWAPKYKDWKKELEKLKIDENSVLIGHSAGGAFLVRWLGETKKEIRKLILVSPGKAAGWHMSYIDDLYGNKTYENLQKFVDEEIILFTAKDDYKHHITNAYNYAKELPAKVLCFEKGFGHFVEKSMGTQEFPELLERIISRQKWPIFTTRPDTIFGVTFMVVSAQHPRLMELVIADQEKEVKDFLKKLKSVSEKELEKLEKEGIFTGSYAINPLNNEKVPVYAGNFVVADYGSGMVMAVPAHDQRDFEFAKKYGIKIRQVIKGGDVKKEAYTGNGVLINSERFNGLESNKAKWNITQYLEGEGLGRKTVNYKLRDWLISRQRYWGTPIPIVYCDKCGIVPVPEKDLPVKLPEKVNFGKGNPLETAKKWINVKCPKCGNKARRETDTMDTFVNSSWYYLRYTDPGNNKKIFSKSKVDYWCPIDQYIGGPEHITMHLIYIRFYTKFLRDIGLLKFDEPALSYFTQGIVSGEDGNKMSKSKGNVIEPLETIEKYGADTLRLALVSFGSSDSDSSWDEKIVIGSRKFLEKVYTYFSKLDEGRDTPLIQNKINKLSKEVQENIEAFKHNLAIIKLREFFNYISDKKISKKTAKSFLSILSIYCPFISEELWSRLGNKPFVSTSKWPKFDESKINEVFEREEEIVNKAGSDINHIKQILGIDKPYTYIYTIPSETKLFKNSKQLLMKLSGSKVVGVYSSQEVKENYKLDPQEKAKKAKPGKPGIYISRTPLDI